jgi:cysteine desulfurase / selenocysteine lyase
VGSGRLTIAMMPDRRLYLDNAATSFPKPACVHEAMVDYATRVGASPGRGAYAESREGARILARCRERLCRLIGGTEPNHLVFTLNASDALNMAIWGAVAHARRRNPGRRLHLVATAMDHNSVLRPFNALADEGVEVTFVDADADTGLVDAAAVASAIRSETVLVAVVHASNVTGVIQPIETIARACREAGCLFLVDASQSAGHLPIDVEGIGIDLLAFPGHKGLLGPLGTGVLYLRTGVEALVDAIRQGGTGTVSEEDTHASTLPEKYEPGSHNMPGIAGLDAAAGYLLERSVASIREHELDLIRLMLDGLTSLESQGLRLLGTQDPTLRVGVFSVVHETVSPDEMAARLERDFGVLTRAGIHCAPRAHRAMGTLSEEGACGATRLSLGPFVTRDDVQYTLKALAEICNGLTSVSSAETTAAC